jgi:uncharacterized protein (TIGR02117 family)
LFRYFPRGRIAAICVAWLLKVQAAASASLAAGTAAHNEVIFVVAGGWHTEIAVPTGLIGGPLSSLKRGFAGAPYVIFGWGARDYYLAHNPGIADLLRAATPGPAVTLVMPLGVSPTAYAGAANAFSVDVSRAGIESLVQFLWGSLAKDRNGAPYEAGAGPYPQSIFYAATGSYDLSHTCNTWTAEALNAAGAPVTAAGVVFAGQLLDQLRERR